MDVFGLKTCDSCRKAMKELQAMGHAPVLHDVRAEPVPEAILSAAEARFGSDLLNTRSTTWRGLSEAERAGEAGALLRAHPALMKRPLVVQGEVMSLGWKADAKEIWLGSAG